ncbi:hypothetical protein [Streptomyces sp. NBRC 110035]|uniref:hypothetical protein n=1 Tax=Streptomyces sp. NBRC 110035 TaxID=1547867 RepID=UPI000ADB5202|nr:hypothetical protein [Streptomyces sp. NBRC 110035]
MAHRITTAGPTLHDKLALRRLQRGRGPALFRRRHRGDRSPSLAPDATDGERSWAATASCRDLLGRPW